MPDFSIQCSIGGAQVVWTDTTVPTRLNAFPGKPPYYLSIPAGMPVIRFSCTVGGVLEPADAHPVMGGRLFKWSWLETVAPPLPIPLLAGQTSLLQFDGWLGAALSSQPGHHMLLCWREHGGSIAVPFIVEP